MYPGHNLLITQFVFPQPVVLRLFQVSLWIGSSMRGSRGCTIADNSCQGGYEGLSLAVLACRCVILTVISSKIHWLLGTYTLVQSEVDAELRTWAVDSEVAQLHLKKSVDFFNLAYLTRVEQDQAPSAVVDELTSALALEASEKGTLWNGRSWHQTRGTPGGSDSTCNIWEESPGDTCSSCEISGPVATEWGSSHLSYESVYSCLLFFGGSSLVPLSCLVQVVHRHQRKALQT